jgi:5-methylcytosine-specific restriction endonuclease McrA
VRREQRSEAAKAWRGFYATKTWKHERRAFLQSNPLCKRCQARGQIVAAAVVNHIQPHKGDWSLFSDPNNWEPLCAPCHDGPTQAAERRGHETGVDASGMPTDPRHPFYAG